MSYWSKLSMKDKADVMRIFLDKGISDLDTMRREYNIFAEGGSVVTSDLLDRVTQEEGFEPHPVDIGDGKMTLGSGLTSKEWRDLYEKRGRKWSQEDNRRAVQTELMRREQWAEKNVPNWNILPDSSKKALLSYKYNYDFTKTNSPKLFQALESGNFREAAKQIDATSKNPKFKKGLTDRRKREQEWFLADIIGNETPAATPPTPVQTPTAIGISMPSITEPAVSTAVRNNYVPATTTPYNRGNNMRRGFESAVAYNKMMDATSLQNNPLPEYQFPISYADGGKIHIDPSKKGTFTAAASKHGMGVQEFASRVLANKENYSPAMVKKANFARNASKWHGLGGNLFDDGGSYSYTKPLDNVIVDKYGNLLDPNVPSARGTIQLPEIIATTRDPRKPVPTANYLNSIESPTTQLRNTLYRRILPTSDYNIAENLSGVLDGEFEYDTWNNPKFDHEEGYPENTDYTAIGGIKAPLSVIDGVWAEYLQIPQKDRKKFTGPTIQQSKYKPSSGGRSDEKYYALPLTKSARALLVDEGVGLPIGKNKVTETLEDSGDIVYNLGYHTIGRGMDSKGDYVSYYDTFDLNPFSGKYGGTNIPLLNKLGDASLGIGKPVHIYDRIYLDDYYGMPKEYRGFSYLPEIKVLRDKPYRIEKTYRKQE